MTYNIEKQKTIDPGQNLGKKLKPGKAFGNVSHHSLVKAPEQPPQAFITPPDPMDLDPAEYEWERVARESQRLPKGDWHVWLILAGRGFGKTRTGAETIRQWVMQGKCRSVALLADNELDARQVMVEGASGILAVHPKKTVQNISPLFGNCIGPMGRGGVFSPQRPLNGCVAPNLTVLGWMNWPNSPGFKRCGTS